MLQSVTTILFLLLLAGGTSVIAASLIDDWASVRTALGLRSASGLAPLPRARVVQPVRSARMIRVSAGLLAQRAA